MREAKENKLATSKLSHRHSPDVGLEHEVELPGRGEGPRLARGGRGDLRERLVADAGRQVIQRHGL